MHIFRPLAFAAALVATMVPAFASAQVEATPIPNAPKPNFSSMQFMIGSWSCSTKSSRRPAAYVTTSTYALDSTGYWIEQSSVTKPVAWVKSTLSVNDKITYDPTTKRWVDVTYGDQGAYGLSFSKGWVGNYLTWHDVSFAPNGDISAQSDTTLTKVSATKVTTTSTFTEAKSGRHVSVATVCTKS
ncbi:MAG TPA: hypothetical protein VGF86_08690 [Candidatus Tumulicola sp.]|jgi:hypothetical protein